jgi:signal transduction histidine kinase
MNEAISRLSPTDGRLAQAETHQGIAAGFWFDAATDTMLLLVFAGLAALSYLASSRLDPRYRTAVWLGIPFFLLCAAHQALFLAQINAAAVGVLAAATGLAALGLCFRAHFSDRDEGRPQAADRNAAPPLPPDADHLRRLEAELSEARREAAAAARAKARFLAYMSHELRTPLNAIIGFSQMVGDELAGGFDRRKYIQYVRDIQSSGEHLLDIVNELLELSRIETGKASLTETAIDPRTLIADVERMVQGGARDGGVALSAAVDLGAPQLVADQRMAKQMLLNLASNAIKFTPPGGKVRLSADTAADGGIVFSVSDTGVGIAPGDIPKALEPFGKLQSDPSRSGVAGFGLGLPICKALAELHGAALEIVSAPGQGTTATIKFPAARSKLRALAG